MTTPLENVLSDLQKLRRSYQGRGLLQVRDGRKGDSAGAPSPLARDLYLAEALLRNVVSRSAGAASGADPTAIHYTVFGGTQVGKSTTINVLAGRAVARVHHTAGFTRHAQGFAAPGVSPQAALAPYPLAFPQFEQVPRDLLSMDRPLEFSLEELPTPMALPDSVLWDSPDCDAVDSALFQQGFVETTTLADAVVYVTSREKYAVNAILAWVVRLIRAGVPVVGVLNMTPRSQQPELLEDMKTALRRVDEAEFSPAEPLPMPPLLAFEYVADGDVSLLYDPAYAPAGRLREQVRERAALSRENLLARKQAALSWMAQTMPSILQPALQDLDAWQQWNDQLSRSLTTFVEDYRRFYLDDPDRYDVFARVGLQILELLNPPIPGLQKTLAAVRTVVSLPARALLAGGKAVYRYASSGGKGFGKAPAVPHEVNTYRDAHQRLLNDLSRTIEQRRRAGAGSGADEFWSALDAGWQGQLAEIEREFQAALAQHQARTEIYIREAAQGIFQELARDPVKLNLLRTSRIAADAAAIVVSIKTGGPGDIVHDIVVAPALMSVVEAATRHIAGSYVDQKKEHLRQQLVEDTRGFADQVYGERLRALAAVSLTQSGLTLEDVENFRTLPERVLALKAEV